MQTRHAAIIGCGAIHTCHVDALRHVPGAVLRAIVDIDSEKGDAPRDKCAHFREINGIAAAFQYSQKNYNPTASSFL